MNAFVLIHPAYTPDIPFFKKYHLRNLIGNPLDTTMAVFSLIAGGVMERFPLLKICLSHGGGYTALAVSRFDHGYEVRQELERRKGRDEEYSQYLSEHIKDLNKAITGLELTEKTADSAMALAEAAGPVHTMVSAGYKGRMR